MTKSQKIIPMVFIILSCLLFITAIILIVNTDHFKLMNQTGNKETQENQVMEENQNKNDESSNDKQNNSTNSEVSNPTTENNNVENNPVEENESNSNSENTSSSNNNVSTSNDENSVISYFEAQNNLITENVDQEDRPLREKAKNAFVTVVDFIFYDKEIKGYTFKELTTSAKLKIIKLGLAIDHKIDEYFPDYKDVIKDKYDNIKGKLAVKYLEFTSSLCETVGVDTCNQAKEDFNTMKESFGFTWQLIKELASSGSSKVKEFYESWRDSE